MKTTMEFQEGFCRSDRVRVENGLFCREKTSTRPKIAILYNDDRFVTSKALLGLPAKPPDVFSVLDFKPLY